MSGPSALIWTVVPLTPTPPLMAILPPPKLPCRSMLPGRALIQPSKEPAVPVRTSGAACGAAKRPSICNGWPGAGERNVAVGTSSTTGGRPQPERSVLPRMWSRAVGRRQHVEVGVADIVLLDQDVGAFDQEPADLD